MIRRCVWISIRLTEKIIFSQNIYTYSFANLQYFPNASSPHICSNSVIFCKIPNKNGKQCSIFPHSLLQDRYRYTVDKTVLPIVYPQNDPFAPRRQVRSFLRQSFCINIRPISHIINSNMHYPCCTHLLFARPSFEISLSTLRSASSPRPCSRLRPSPFSGRSYPKAAKRPL